MTKLIDDIASLKAQCLRGDIKSEKDASQALASFAEERRKQLIAAIYTGREHIHDQRVIPPFLTVLRSSNAMQPWPAAVLG